MPTAHDHYSQQFQKWEVRGRGWQVFPEPVSPEPPFVPFGYRKMTETLAPDDGRKPTLLSSLMRKVANTVAPKPAPEPVETEVAEEESTTLERGAIVELQASLPDRLDVSRDAFAQFLTNLSLCQEPIAFELIGSHKKVTAQFVAGAADSSLVKRQLQAFFPEAVFMPVERNLENALDAATGDDLLAVEFGLESEFMLPLASGKLDPFIGLIGALSDLGPEELGLYQIIFQPVQNPWAQSMVFAVSDADGKPMFENTPELLHAAEAKASKPLFAAVVRIMVCADGYDRMLQLSSELAGSLRVFDNLDGNALIPLHNSGYPFVEHIEDVMKRQTHRAGMILDSDELFGFAHIPSSAVRSPVFKRQATTTKPAPDIVKFHSGLLLGTNEHMGETTEVRLSLEARVRHTHIIGASGTGKSTLLFNLIRQSIENGEGIAVLDPHGDLIDRVLGIIPEERIGDVVLVDPADEDYAIGFNILSAHSNLEKNLLASDLIAVFQRLSTSWGDQMNSVLQNAILAFLESSRGGTIADLRRFLIETPYRNEFLKTVNDSEVVYYWQKSFSHLAGNKSIGSILTRLDTFLAQKPIRHMVSQRENRLDFGHIMDSGKILLAKLPEGLLGRENSHLLGTLLVSKFQQIAMSRQAQRVESRRMFNIVIDEFANFITPSMAEILSGARKYRIGLTLAHHELHQLQRSPEVASAVMTHPYTRIVFRVGDDDARKLADGFSFFESNHLRNLETGQAICRVERSDFDFNLTVPLPELIDEDAAAARRQEVITASRESYSIPRSEVEAMLSASRKQPDEEPPPASPPAQPAKPVPPSPAPVAAAPTEEPAPAAPKFERPPPLSEILKSAQAKKPAAPAPEPKEPPPTPTPGRGGEVHQAIQKRIRDEAERLGFLSIIEKPVLDGRACIDVWLERDGLTIACEVSFTNTEDYEAEKIARCLNGGIPRMAMICADAKKLRNMAAAIESAVSPELASRVEYFIPDEFIAHLKGLPVAPKKTKEIVSHGYKITSSKPAASTEAQKAKEEAAIRAIAESMKRKKK